MIKDLQDVVQYKDVKQRKSLGMRVIQDNNMDQEIKDTTVKVGICYYMTDIDSYPMCQEIKSRY